MTTELDTKIGPKVKDALAEFGKTVTFTVVTRLPNELSGEVSSSEVPHTVKVSPPKLVVTWKGRDIVEGTRTQVLLAALDLPFSPALASKITIDTVEYLIVDRDDIYSGDDIAAYKFLLKTT